MHGQFFREVPTVDFGEIFGKLKSRLPQSPSFMPPSPPLTRCQRLNAIIGSELVISLLGGSAADIS